MGRCLRCAAKQREEGKEEKEIIWTTYQGETSRSVVSRAREHFEQYRAAMKKLPPPRPPLPSQGGLGEAGTGGRGQWEGEEEGSSWMADHTRSHHDGQMSSNPMDDYDFLVLDQFRKPLQRQIEQAVMTKGFLLMGRGPKAKPMKMNRRLMNRKMENFSPWFLTMGGGDGGPE